MTQNLHAMNVKIHTSIFNKLKKEASKVSFRKMPKRQILMYSRTLHSDEENSFMCVIKYKVNWYILFLLLLKQSACFRSSDF